MRSRALRRGAGACAAIGLLWCGAGSGPTRDGVWSGLGNMIAPEKGTFTLAGARGGAATCTLRGKTGTASGSGWVFRGDASVEETSCEGEIDRSGRVSALLKVCMDWRGRIKGIGGDWDDVDGSATCEGDLTGTLAEGGAWQGTCERDDREWKTSVRWEVSSE